jgi:DNA sulfur modification protein DndC
MDNMTKIAYWAYLLPLKGLRPIWRELRLPQHRLRKTGLETSEKNKQRMGPIIIKTRMVAFKKIMSIQNNINKVAKLENKPMISLLNREEHAYIKSCWRMNKWPNRWDGTEPTADTPMDTVYPDGSIQPLIQFGE